MLTTPLFRDVYGVDTADLGFVWLAGPLSGLLVQVIVWLKLQPRGAFCADTYRSQPA